jgi:hypothetical protein
MFAHAFGRPNLLSRIYRLRRNPVRVYLGVVFLAFAAMTIESASSHDKGYDGNPLPVRIKLDWCGKADEHQLKPEQITRGSNGNVWMIVGGESLRFPNTPDEGAFSSVKITSRHYGRSGRSSAQG